MYILSKRWYRRHIGGNGSINWCIQITNTMHDPIKDRAYQNPFDINSSTFSSQKAHICDLYPEIAKEYDSLETELAALPKNIADEN